MSFSSKSFKISASISPLRYTNKLLLGSLQGALQLWNVKSGKQLYWFKGFGAGVTCIKQAPALDVCAIGLSDGRVILHNIKYDVTLAKLTQDHGAVSAIDFRSGTHGLSNPANVEADSDLTLFAEQMDDVYVMVGTASGHLSSWCLKEDGKALSAGKTKTHHWERIVSIYCVPSGECAGAMVTSGADNCIKVAYFDRADCGPRVVYKRAGHFRPATRTLFWPGGCAGGQLLLSAGQDSQLRIFSTFNEHLEKSLGRAYAPGAPDRRKATSDQRSAWLLPGVSQLSACANRAEEWDSVVAIHEGRRQATTWNFVNSTRGRHWLDPAKFTGKTGSAVRIYKHTTATAVCVTNCGNYVLLGYSTGDVVKFNLQSGLERGVYGGGDNAAHPGTPIVSVSVNNVNRIVITVAGCEVRYWCFSGNDLLGSTDLESPALFARFHLDNELVSYHYKVHTLHLFVYASSPPLPIPFATATKNVGDTSDNLAVALTTGSIILLDTIHRKIIRRFVNPDTQLPVDMTMSSDGRWLIAAHRGDPLLKTWDIVHGRLIDCFRVDTPVTSLAISPGNEFLATTHNNSLGVHLWDNMATYRRIHLQPLADDFVPLPETKPVAAPARSLTAVFPTTEDDESETVKDDGGMSPDVDMELEETMECPPSLYTSYVSPSQLPDQLITLSGLPASQLKTFFHIDLIRQRNRQAVAQGDDAGVEQNKDAPFFLPVKETVKGLVWVDNDERTLGYPQETDSLSTGAVVKSASGTNNYLDNLSGAMQPLTSLPAKLAQAETDEDYDEVMKTVKSLGPSALDLEIRLLAPSLEEEEAVVRVTQGEGDLPAHIHEKGNFSRDRLHGFIRLLINRFERNLDVDLAAACLDAVLRRHGDLIVSSQRPDSEGHRPSGSIGNEQLDTAIHQLWVREAEISTAEEASLSAESLTTYQLIGRAVKAKQSAQRLVTRQLTRAIALAEFVRNSGPALQF